MINQLCRQSARMTGLAMLAFMLGFAPSTPADEEAPVKPTLPGPGATVTGTSETGQSVEGKMEPTDRRPSTDAVVRVVNQPPQLFSFLNVRRPVRPSVSAGQIAFSDGKGRLISRPAGSQFSPAPARRRSAQPFAFRGVSSAGGIGVDTSHVRAYSYATVNADGTLSTDCVQGDLEDVRKAIAADRDDNSHGHDHSGEKEAAKN